NLANKLLMKLLFIILAGFSFSQVNAQNNLPFYNNAIETNYSKDWLITPVAEKAAIYQSNDGKDIILYNGLVKRSFRLQPNLACIDYKNTSNGQQLLRALKPEAEITINGIQYNIGGLYGQTE